MLRITINHDALSICAPHRTKNNPVICLMMPLAPNMPGFAQVALDPVSSRPWLVHFFSSSSSTHHEGSAVPSTSYPNHSALLSRIVSDLASDKTSKRANLIFI